MKKRVFWSIFLIALTAVALVAASTLAVLSDIFGNELMANLKTQTEYLSHALNESTENTESAAFLSGLSEKNRITLISADGTVIYDNEQDALKLPNHSNRPEIKAALETGSGESRRYSDTALEQYLYYAKRLDDGSVLRLSNTQRSALSLLDSIFTPLFLISVAVAIAAAVIARLIARKLMEPIAKVDFSAPLEGDIYDELSPLLTMMQQKNDALSEQNEQLEQKRRELTAVMDNMREGMLLLNEKGEILSVNNSAATALNVDAEGCAGRKMIELLRDTDVLFAVDSALKGGAGEAETELNGRVYSFIVNPVLRDGSVLGAVALLVDVTERRELEKSRREFTANVTHELKTPLTSIVGYAEIMRDGVAKPEDMREFSGRIYQEGKRMIQLVEDILRLSQLDERQRLPELEAVELLPLCENIVDRLSHEAENAGVSLELTGDNASVYGMPKLIDEMIFNLADNAIKYNSPGGSAAIELNNDEDGVRVRVIDNGMGIPKEHIPHVFERFYRVDKSHSKATGGTGLGLSIVKHVAAVHSAKLELESEEGKGTAITITFPHIKQAFVSE